MGEYFRSPSMHGGSLHDDDKLKALDTGLFMSNIHYLNWSDNLGGRITGLCLLLGGKWRNDCSY